jgi:8-oxo-dGTP pyrophosphatase MutT (NUDIX family)
VSSRDRSDPLDPASRPGSAPEELARWEHGPIEELQDCKVFRVGRSWTRSPRTGDLHPFYRIDSPDWVNVVPLTDDDRVVLVRQFRHGARAHTLEIPGGMVDPGEDPATAAARELIEETGFEARSIATLGHINPNPALFGNRCHMFVARGVRRVREIANTDLEETHVELVPRSELGRLARSGAIDHALVVVAIYWLEQLERT